MNRHRARAASITAVSIFVIGALGSRSGLAFSKAKPPANPAKIVVQVKPVESLTISLPQAILPSPTSSNAPTFNFGPQFNGALCPKLISTHYLCTGPNVAEQPNAGPQPSPSPSSSNPIYQWPNSQDVVPAATFSFSVDALALRTGGHGDRMFYGFDERLRNPFNDGLGTEPNEFPLTLIQFQQWFDRTFQDRGTSPFDSQSGLDLGQGFDLNAVVAEFGLKYESYNAVLRMHVTMDAPLVGRHEVKTVQVKGGGLFFDVVGGYEQWSGAIGISRADAMNAAYNNAFASTYTVIDDWSQTLPFTAKVAGFQSAQVVFLNTGVDSNIPAGTKFSPPGNPGLVFEVWESVPSGSVAKLDAGTTAQIQLGMVLVQEQVAAQPQIKPALAGAPVPVGNVSINLPKVNLPKSDLAAAGVQVQNSTWTTILGTVTGGPVLPYRIWRYYQYDQSFLGVDWQLQGPNGPVDEDGNPIGSIKDLSAKDSPSPDLPQGAEDWATRMKSEPWAKQIGLDVAPAMTNEGPVVAIIDSGVDYNHPALNERLWTNPNPVTDPDGNTDTYGWDFISGDPRPFDDGYHGTEVASLVVGLAPLVHIMPLKVFNPFGITSSAAIYGAFQYAVDHGAKIIVAAWATQLSTKTLDLALMYAHDHGVLVVVSAGDRGDDLSKTPSYPVTLSKKYDNVVAVTGVDTSDQPVKVSSFFANFDPSSVTIAAPGENILVAQPRSHTGRDTTTSLAAGIVAGALARNWAATEGAGTYADWIKALKSQSQAVPGLASTVSGGLRLRVK